VLSLRGVEGDRGGKVQLSKRGSKREARTPNEAASPEKRKQAFRTPTRNYLLREKGCVDKADQLSIRH